MTYRLSNKVFIIGDFVQDPSRVLHRTAFV